MEPCATPQEHDWLLPWREAASAVEAAGLLARHGFVVVLATRDAQGLPEPLPTERASAQATPDPQGTLIRRAIARAVAGAALGQAASVFTIETDKRGAPRFACGSLQVSFSARGDQAAIALGKGVLGVDLEPALPPGGVPWNLLRPEEREALEACPPPAQGESFLRLWRAKEAVVKALGEGFALPPEAVRVEASRAFAGGRSFLLHHAPATGLCLALPESA